ncbi:hypothetical protein DFQ28_000046 [Apophysomyces sp. BC1034]|nr:hypothetical protein DFQ30_007798 [Apophysomyces sp. BC1015]KAG0182844.1 hypothetical protein DFQ29_001784 [Apophysomyces sp. BC1021]KAG0194947.1 hypothetical protein DFQ28_000046 [Apophysomyces sp. BC1034]
MVVAEPMNYAVDKEMYAQRKDGRYSMKRTLTTLLKSLEDIDEPIFHHIRLQELHGAQLVEFLNTVFLPTDPGNSETYTNYTFSTAELMQLVSNIAKDIVGRLRSYQTELQMLCDQSLMVAGYARKSKATRESDEDRVRLLQMMVSRLKKRSRVQRTYVTISCNSKDAMIMRDMPRPELIDKISNIDSTIQDLLLFLKASTKSTCLVILDCPGLSTDPDDVYQLVCKHPKLKKVVIDQIPSNGKITIFDRDGFLAHPEQ